MTEPSNRGSSGGTARKEKLSPERRSEIAKAAASKRWAKKDSPQPVNGALHEDGIHAENMGLEPTVYPTYGGIERGSMPIVEKNINPPSVPFQAIPVTINPAVLSPTPVQPPPEPTKAVQKRRKPMVKEFGKAYSRAEKLLEEALKKRSDAVKIIIACNEDIPMYVNVIKSLGGTVDPQAMRSVDIRSLNGNGAIPNMTYQQPQYQPQAEQITAAPNNIDPALFQANSNPLPGLAPALANAPVVANKPLGGAIDLDFVPVDDEGPELPKMGGGWQ